MPTAQRAPGTRLSFLHRLQPSNFSLFGLSSAFSCSIYSPYSPSLLFSLFHHFSLLYIALHCVFGGLLWCHHDGSVINIVYVYIIAYLYIPTWISRSNKKLPGIHQSTTIFLRLHQQREDIRPRRAVPPCQRMIVMTRLVRAVDGRDPQWSRSLHSYLPCGRRICRGLYPKKSFLACLN